MKFAFIWIYKMRWWLLVVAAITLVYVVGAPKDMSLLEWVKDLIKEKL